MEILTCIAMILLAVCNVVDIKIKDEMKASLINIILSSISLGIMIGGLLHLLLSK